MKQKTTYLFAVAVLVLFCKTSAWAANVSWTGTGNGTLWSDPNNWSGHVLPASGDDVTIGVVAGNPTIQITAAAGVVQINSLTSSEPINVSGGTLQIATTFQTSKSVTLSGGTLKGGNLPGMTVSGSLTLDGVTLNGDLTVSSNASLYVKNGLTLNNAKLILSSTGYYAYVYFQGTQTLGGTGEVVFAGTSYTGYFYAQGTDDTAAGGATLTIGANITIHGKNGYIGVSHAYDSIVNNGTINADDANGGIALYGGTHSTLTNQGAIGALNGASLFIAEPIATNGQGTINSSSSSKIQFGGNLVGNTTAIALSNVRGTTTLSGVGSVISPILIEAMSQDLGADVAGYNNNFAYGTIILPSNGHYKLTDASDNAPGTAAEALYTQALLVPSGCTLDLNGLHLYARVMQIAGTVLNGTIIQMPDSGELTLNMPTPGALNTQGQTNEWTLYERTGNVLSVSVNPGSTGSPTAISPQVQWVLVQLLDGNNIVIASASVVLLN